MSNQNQNPNQKPPATEVDVQGVLAEAQKTGNLSETKFMALLSIMMAKEARIAEKEAALEVALQAKDKQRRHESETYTINKIETQKRCSHLKGGKTRTRGQQRDPNVYAHTFTNGQIHIKCNGCGARWMPGDTDEYLTRNGSKIPNWTGIGWRRAQGMAEDSSNKASSSERFGGGQVSVESTDAGKKLTGTPNLQL